MDYEQIVIKLAQDKRSDYSNSSSVQICSELKYVEEQH